MDRAERGVCWEILFSKRMEEESRENEKGKETARGKKKKI